MKPNLIKEYNSFSYIEEKFKNTSHKKFNYQKKFVQAFNNISILLEKHLIENLKLQPKYLMNEEASNEENISNFKNLLEHKTEIFKQKTVDLIIFDQK
ncbi:hypothetical protein [Mycoplasma phocimorsus]|uniref:hypothetical protein n=1 Tax=Mycoplasma phocimorsus TaxID=3045839 RepID=UPI0024C04321|nr:hypothetical protein [Mycoplasma phocimorsus]MDJ1646894.1 hypothetical protein [Mycoplasma phocimorsus]